MQVQSTGTPLTNIATVFYKLVLDNDCSQLSIPHNFFLILTLYDLFIEISNGCKTDVKPPGMTAISVQPFRNISFISSVRCTKLSKTSIELE